MNREEVLREAKKYFLEVMSVGWASGAKGKPVPDMPGYGCITNQKQLQFGLHLGITDCWGVSRSGVSEGTTRIWYSDGYSDWEPVWIMWYFGFYPKEVIPFLKRALMHCYERGEFLGGRGPQRYIGGYTWSHELRYQNIVARKSDFLGFKGREHILGLDNDLEMGWHLYRGRALI